METSSFALSSPIFLTELVNYYTRVHTVEKVTHRDIVVENNKGQPQCLKSETITTDLT